MTAAPSMPTAEDREVVRDLADCAAKLLDLATQAIDRRVWRPVNNMDTLLQQQDIRADRRRLILVALGEVEYADRERFGKASWPSQDSQS